MNYAVGDVITYRTFANTLQRVKVTARHEDIKRGRPGFDGLTTDTQTPVWGYDSQIERGAQALQVCSECGEGHYRLNWDERGTFYTCTVCGHDVAPCDFVLEDGDNLAVIDDLLHVISPLR